MAVGEAQDGGDFLGAGGEEDGGGLACGGVGCVGEVGVGVCGVGEDGAGEVLEEVLVGAG